MAKNGKQTNKSWGRSSRRTTSQQNTKRNSATGRFTVGGSRSGRVQNRVSGTVNNGQRVIRYNSNKGSDPATKQRPQAAQQPTGWEAIAGLIGTVEAPIDWSAEHDHYLYGSPKREK
jgi:hypothetical protein